MTFEASECPATTLAVAQRADMVLGLKAGAAVKNLVCHLS